MTIKLRDVTVEDLPTLYLFQNDPEANAMAAFPAREERAFIEHWTKNIIGNKEGIKKTILADNQIVGSMVSWKQDDKWYLGYWIGKEFWGKGIASKALVEFLTFSTGRPLYAYVAEHNKASLRVLEKCGFKVHGHEIKEILLVL